MKLTKDQINDIKEQQSQNNSTKRVTAPELEKILYEAIPALDHGFIRVIDYMGDDSSIVQSARVSYGKGTKQVSTDSGLIKYLMRHWHSTPFEMCEIKYHVKLPIREVRLSSGAEFIVVVCGAIMTMPGLPKVPAADKIKINDKGETEGLF